MIKHIVLLSFNDGVTQDQIDVLENELKKLMLIIPEILSFSFGKNCSFEELNQGYSHGFIMEFSSHLERDAYLEHPKHVELAENLIIPIVKKNGGALVFDY